MPSQIKACLVGYKNSGKTSLFNKIIHDEDQMTSPTISAYFGYKKTDHLNLALWDTAGNPKFHALTEFYLRDAGIVIICIDPFSADYDNDMQELQKALAYYEAQPAHGFLLVLTKKDLLSEENKALVEARINKIKESFKKYTSEEPLFISSKNDSVKLVTEAIDKRVLIGCQILKDLQALKINMNKRFFKPDPTRLASIGHLITVMENEKATIDEIKTALINEACFIRKRNDNGTYKYGNFFGFHFRGVEHSALYTYIKNKLSEIDKTIDLAKESAPEVSAPVRPKARVI